MGNLLILGLSGRKEGYNYFYFVKCLLCGKVYERGGNNIKTGINTSCGCAQESNTATILKSHFETNYDAILEFKDVRNPKTNALLSYDIYIPKFNLYIEINGEQHYTFMRHWHGTRKNFNAQKKRDELKIKNAKTKGEYFEVDLRISREPEYWIKKIEDRIYA